MKTEQRLDRDAVSVSDLKEYYRRITDHLKRPLRAGELGNSSGGQSRIAAHILGEERSDTSRMSAIEKHIFGIAQAPSTMSPIRRHIFNVQPEAPTKQRSAIRDHIFGGSDE